MNESHKISSSYKYNKFGEQLHQYVFITGKGTSRSSETRHMTETQASEHKKQLGI